MHKLAILLGVALIFPLTAGAQIYKWKDSNGVVRYSDIPPANTKYESLSGGGKTTTPAAPPAPAAEATKKPGDVADKNGKPQEASKDEKPKDADAKTKEAEAKQKKTNCEAAKKNLEGLKEGGLVYKTDENGERSYLDEDAINKEVEQNQKLVDKNCN